MKTYLGYTDSKSEKFWEVSVKGKVMTILWGQARHPGPDQEQGTRVAEVGQDRGSETESLEGEEGLQETLCVNLIPYST
jgi:predicted DNA-binding WGR domain protein|tara:strand:+ start:3293 stop:3529 length:237 start_codon:yes stop_codon:yes gene_type:complete